MVAPIVKKELSASEKMAALKAKRNKTLKNADLQENSTAYNKNKANEGEVLDGKATTSAYSNDANVDGNNYVEMKEIKVEAKKEPPKVNVYINRSNLKKNILEQFRTHSQIWSMYILTPEEYSQPDETFMQSEPMINIIRGAGGSQNMKGRRVTTQLEDAHGRVEYYIDNVEMNSVVGPGGPTRIPPVHEFRWEVTEPYSMGQFLESLQIGAVMAGYKTYISAPILLMCDFIGHTDDNQTKRVARRYFPLQLGTAMMTVDAGGTKYECSGVSRNGAAYTDGVQQIQTDITIIGGTIEQALQSGSQSLTRVMNTTLLERESTEHQQYADEYIIVFPKVEDVASKKIKTDEAEVSEKATYDPKEMFETRYGENQGEQEINYEEWIKNVTGFSVQRSKTSDALRAGTVKQENMNTIGTSKLLRHKLDDGAIKPATYYASYDAKKNVFEQGSIAIPPDLRAFKFTKGTKLNEIIEEMIVASEYGKELMNKKPDEHGYREWFNIQAMIFDIPVKQVADKIGRLPKIYVFKVFPYKVHASLWMSPSDVPPGQNHILRDVRKEYNYIYTGKNKDVLGFDIKYEYRFMTPVPMDKGKKQTQSQNQVVVEKETDTVNQSSEGKTEEAKVPMKAVGMTDIQPITSGMRGTALDGVKDTIARSFHQALINSNVDLINLQLRIMGDPWYLSDSGLGNYQADSGPIMFDDENQQMDYVKQQIFVSVNFRTPWDIDPVSQGGLLSSKGDMIVKPFSGLYRVVKLRSSFNQGQFEQELDLLRMPNQTDLDTLQKEDADNKGVVEGSDNETDADGPEKNKEIKTEARGGLLV